MKPVSQETTSAVVTKIEPRRGGRRHRVHDRRQGRRRQGQGVPIPEARERGRELPHRGAKDAPTPTRPRPSSLRARPPGQPCWPLRVPARLTRRPANQPFIPLLVLLAALTAVFFMLPLIGLIARTPWGDVFGIDPSPSSLEALRLSLICSLASTALALVLGVPAGLGAGPHRLPAAGAGAAGADHPADGAAAGRRRGRAPARLRPPRAARRSRSTRPSGSSLPFTTAGVDRRRDASSPCRSSSSRSRRVCARWTGATRRRRGRSAPAAGRSSAGSRCR